MENNETIAEAISPTIGMVERASEDFMALQVEPHTKNAKLNFYLGMITALELVVTGKPITAITAFALNAMNELGD
jgi:hypothetical protein